MKPTKFPERIFVAHYGHSRESSLSLAACLTQKEAIETDAPREGRAVTIAEYQLVRTTKLGFQVAEVPLDCLNLDDGKDCIAQELEVDSRCEVCRTPRIDEKGLHDGRGVSRNVCRPAWLADRSRAGILRGLSCGRHFEVADR